MGLILVIIIIALIFGGGGFYGYRGGFYGGRGFGGISLFGLLLILLLFWALSGAHAEGYITLVNATTGPSTEVALHPVYDMLSPYILMAFGVVFSALFTWALAILQKHTSIKVTADAKAAVQQAAMNAAGRIVTMLGDKIGPASIDVHSELIADEVPKIMKALPNELRQSGMSPADVDVRLTNLIAGKLGQLTAPTPVVVAKPVAA